MNLSDVKSITIPEGAVKRILSGSKVLWKKRSLTFIDYIETSGTQFIDTGFKPDNNTRVVFDFMALPFDGENSLLGRRGSSTSRIFAFSVRNSGTWRYGYGSEYFGSKRADTNRHIVDANKNIFSMDGNTLYTVDEAVFTTSSSMYIGAVSSGSTIRYGYVRIYACQIYDNGTLVRDFVPCINADGEVGMWDKLNDVFYGNAGSGEFITAT